jgi:hypothetical protein
MGRQAVLAKQAERVLAEIDRMQAELDAGELIVFGSRGQPQPNRLLAELRAHRWLLARLVTDGPGTGNGQPSADVIDDLRREWVGVSG